MNDFKSLKGKYALITGSSRGIGQQIALGLASMGCNILVHGRTKQRCNETLNLLSEYPIVAYSVFGELSDENQLDELINQVINLGVRIDILYNNAAIMRPVHHDIWAHSWEDWKVSYKVNVFGLYKLCGAFIPAMIENGYGRVVNLSSGIMNSPQLAPYGATKWAVNKLTHDIASTLKGTGVRINALDPGWLQTDMGGSNAEHPVERVLPGALAPTLVPDDGPNGVFFSAIEKSFKEL